MIRCLLLEKELFCSKDKMCISNKRNILISIRSTCMENRYTKLSSSIYTLRRWHWEEQMLRQMITLTPLSWGANKEKNEIKYFIAMKMFIGTYEIKIFYPIIWIYDYWGFFENFQRSLERFNSGLNA